MLRIILSAYKIIKSKIKIIDLVSEPSVPYNKLAKQVIGNMVQRKARRWMVFVATFLSFDKFDVGVAGESMIMEKN